MNTDENAPEGLEDRLFKSLSNGKRRDIIRLLGESRGARFNEIRGELGFEDGASLSYHLTSLEPLIAQRGGVYGLSEAGRDAYNLMRRIAQVASSTRAVESVRRELTVLIVVNAILWAAAILSVRLNEGNLQQATIFSFASLWFLSNLIIFAMVQRLRR